MVMNTRLREMAFQKASTDALRDQARRDGMNTLLEDGLRKVLDGWTTLDEVLARSQAIRVTAAYGRPRKRLALA